MVASPGHQPAMPEQFNMAMLGLILRAQQQNLLNSLAAKPNEIFSPPDLKLMSTPLSLAGSSVNSSNSLASSAISATPSFLPSPLSDCTPKKRVRRAGSSVKTAEVWKFFEQLPPPEQAASCNICHKTIKATNSSTTGMIRHLRSCHHNEYEELQEARTRNQLLKSITNLGPQSEQYAQQLKDLMVPKPENNSLDSVHSPNPSEDQSSSYSGEQFSFEDFKNTLIKRNQQTQLTSATKLEEDEPPTPDEQHPPELAKENRDHAFEMLDHYIARMLIMDKLPVETVENAGFRALIRHANSDYKMPSAEQFRSQILPKVRTMLTNEYLKDFQTNNDSGVSTSTISM